MASNKLDSSSDGKKDPFHLPSQYKFLKVMGEGGFGTVVKCLIKDTKQTVAIKIPKYDTEEFSMLNKFMNLDFDKRNIVKFHGWFHMTCGKALVFEILDLSLNDYLIKTWYAPMLMSDIRTIIQQVAIAFDALKSIGVIHTDIKPDNIMLATERRPFRVKLIDFGLAITRSEARQGMSLQTLSFKSPEIILGLPFNEAIDMWSLGSVMFLMMTGFLIFSEQNKYDTLQCMIEALGPPANHLLIDGQKTELYFRRTKFDSWRLKTPLEFWGKTPTTHYMGHSFKALDELKPQLVSKKIRPDNAELDQWFDLLKAMLRVDANERITPSEVRTHPFIADGLHSSRNEPAPAAATCCSEYKAWFTKDISPKKTDKSKNERIGSTSIQSPSRLMNVCPAAPGNNLEMDSDVESGTSLQANVKKTSEYLTLLSVSEGSDCEPPATTSMDEDTADIQSDFLSLSSSLPPSCVIMVRPATAENTLLLEDEESLDSLQTELSKASESSLTDPGMDTTYWTFEDSPTLDDIGIKMKTPPPKKKNAFRRIFSWMKKTFGSCLTSAVDK